MAQRLPADTEPQYLSQNELDQKPWKYIGYKAFTRYVSSDDDFLALRRFDRIHCRLLLRLQDQVNELEERLDLLDTRLSERSADDIDNGSVRKDTKERNDLLNQLCIRLGQYDELLCRFIELKASPKASRTTIKNIKIWLSNNNNPIDPRETEFIRAADLISVVQSPKSTFRRLVEQHVLVPTKGLFGLLRQSQSQELGPENCRTIVQGSDEHVDILAAVIVFIVAVVMLIVPLWVLAIVQDMFRKLAVITVFLTVFLAVLTWGTFSRPFEILAATAGYSAVLVVFLQFGINYDPSI